MSNISREDIIRMGEENRQRNNEIRQRMRETVRKLQESGPELWNKFWCNSLEELLNRMDIREEWYK